MSIIVGIFGVATYIIKVLEFLFRAVLANFILLVIDKFFATIYVL